MGDRLWYIKPIGPQSTPNLIEVQEERQFKLEGFNKRLLFIVAVMLRLRQMISVLGTYRPSKALCSNAGFTNTKPHFLISSTYRPTDLHLPNYWKFCFVLNNKLVSKETMLRWLETLSKPVFLKQKQTKEACEWIIATIVNRGRYPFHVPRIVLTRLIKPKFL